MQVVLPPTLPHTQKPTREQTPNNPTSTGTVRNVLYVSAVARQALRAINFVGCTGSGRTCVTQWTSFLLPRDVSRNKIRSLVSGDLRGCFKLRTLYVCVRVSYIAELRLTSYPLCTDSCIIMTYVSWEVGYFQTTANYKDCKFVCCMSLDEECNSYICTYHTHK